VFGEAGLREFIKGCDWSCEEGEGASRRVVTLEQRSGGCGKSRGIFDLWRGWVNFGLEVDVVIGELI